MNAIKRTISTIEHIEKNLTEKLELSTIAKAVHSSPYYLHRTFSMTTGMTIHDYLRRRQLTEAAKLLSFSNKSILEIALLTGYENQQSFSKIFKSMYKHSPDSFRKNQLFYPLQQQFNFRESSDTLNKNDDNIRPNIRFAEKSDLSAWMDLVNLVVDGYPFLNEKEHIQVVEKHIKEKQALIVMDGEVVIGNILFSYDSGSIDFLGVHPLYRRWELFKILLNKVLFEFLAEKKSISITTYRKDDKADIGYRKALKGFGFVESELLTEFGYPTQKLLFQKD